MKIEIQTLESVAKEVALKGKAAAKTDGYVVVPAGECNWIRDEWEGNDFPFGKSAWENLWKHFGSYVETDPNSVHGGKSLPKDGVAVLNCGTFAIILRQVINDNLWWDWEWWPDMVIKKVD